MIGSILCTSNESRDRKVLKKRGFVDRLAALVALRKPRQILVRQADHVELDIVAAARGGERRRGRDEKARRGVITMVVEAGRKNKLCMLYVCSTILWYLVCTHGVVYNVKPTTKVRSWRRGREGQGWFPDLCSRGP